MRAPSVTPDEAVRAICSVWARARIRDGWRHLVDRNLHLSSLVHPPSCPSLPLSHLSLHLCLPAVLFHSLEPLLPSLVTFAHKGRLCCWNPESRPTGVKTGTISSPPWIFSICLCANSSAQPPSHLLFLSVSMPGVQLCSNTSESGDGWCLGPVLPRWPEVLPLAC